jgi:DNA-binding PadR family transcriptional regulator
MGRSDAMPGPWPIWHHHFGGGASWMPGAWMGEGRGRGRGRGRHQGGFGPGEYQGGPGFPPFNMPLPPGRAPFGDPRSGWWGGPGGFGHFRRGPRVRRGDVRAAALALLSEEPRNGYQIIQEINARSGGLWRPSPGSVYPALQQLQDEGLVRAEESGGTGRVFHLTDEGRSYVEANREELAEPWAAVAETVSGDVVELRELFGGLFFAAMQVTHAGTPAQIAEAHKVLDEARRRLYRILAEAGPATERDEEEDGEDGSSDQGAPR